MYTKRSAAYLWILLGAQQARADDAPGAPEAPSAATPVIDPNASDEVIVVEGHAPEPVEIRIPISQLREVPGAMGDPVRAMTALPGVVPTTGNRPEFYIRGAPPGNTGSFVDGIHVPLLFHCGVASSIVPAALVSAVDFFASAAPARHGGVVGGAIEVETAAPSVRPSAAVAMKAYEAGAVVETPVADGRGSVLGAARVGYPQLVTEIVSDAGVRVFYWDYQARASWALGDHDRVSVLAFGSHDRIGELQADDPGTPAVYVEQLASDFHRVDLRYDHTTAASHVRAAVTGGWGAQGAGDISVHDLMYSARVEGETRLAATLQARAGVQLQRDVYRLGATTSTSSNPAAMSPANADPPPRNTMIGGYVDLVWDARDDLRITPGLRFDVYDSTRGVDGASGTVPVVEPRLSARWRILSELSLLVTAGIAHQYPLLRIGNAPPTAVAVPGFWAADRQLQRAQQASAGAEWLLPGAFTATATGFGSVTYGLTDLQESCDSPRFGPPNMQAVASCGDTRSTGIAYGIELSLRRPLTERLAGWLSYTLSRATERTRDAAGTQTLLSTFDRTHVASASVAYQVSAGWRAGARIVAYTGAPLLVPASADGTVPASQLRLPWFERVDLRAERRWNLAHDRSISLVFDLLNATLSREYNNVTCAAGTTTCTLRPGGPFVVPSIGVEGGF